MLVSMSFLFAVKSKMDALTLLFFGLSFSSCSQFPLRKYYYVNLEISWSDAQHHCREKYTDLATIESTDDISRLKTDFPYSWAWIGLRDDPKSWKEVMGNDTNSWRWSATGETSKTAYHNWNVNEPNSASAKENCVLMMNNGKWHDAACASARSFVCYNGTNQNEKTYVFIPTSRTWNSAQAYCRKHYTDLATIENHQENNQVYSTKLQSSRVWIGLYRLPWTWSDQTQSSFRSWDSTSPNNYGRIQYCVGENTRHEWNDMSCQHKHPFICHQVLRLKNMLTMKIATVADLTDPAVNTQILQQLSAVLTSQGWTDFDLQWRIQPRK